MMGKYSVVCIKEAAVKYYFIRNMDTYDIVEEPARYLMHKIRANRSPNTIRRAAFSLCYYMEYLEEKQMELQTVYTLDYENQYQHFSDFLYWLKVASHKEHNGKLPRNRTCNAYLKDVFRFYLFMESGIWNTQRLSFLSYNQILTTGESGIKRTIR